MNYGVDEFSICLKKQSGAPGYLTWGPTYSNLVKGTDYATIKVIGDHHWVGQLTSVQFGHTNDKAVTVPCTAGQGCAAIFDSGTSLIAAPGAALMQLSEQIPPIMEDCSNMHELPPLRFVVDGHTITLPPQAYVMRVKDKSESSIWDILFFKPKQKTADICMPAFMQLDMESKHGPVWILGMPFFRYYHVTFDRRNAQVHLAIAGPDCEPRAYHEKSLLAIDSMDKTPMDMTVGSMIPPTLAEMMDFPFGNGGNLTL
jgi:hypothetical protein